MARIGKIRITFVALGPFTYAASTRTYRMTRTRIMTTATTLETMTTRGELSSSPGLYRP